MHDDYESTKLLLHSSLYLWHGVGDDDAFLAVLS